MSLNHILKNCTRRCKHKKIARNNQPPNAQADTILVIAGKDQPTNIHGQHQTFYQKQKRITNPNTDIKNILWWYSHGVWYRKMCHANKEKRENDKWLEK